MGCCALVYYSFIKISLTFLYCVFSNGPSRRLHKKMQSHIGCICLNFPHCGFSNAFSKDLYERMHSHIGCTYLTLLHCVFSNVSSNGLPERIQNHTTEEAGSGTLVSDRIGKREAFTLLLREAMGATLECCETWLDRASES